MLTQAPLPTWSQLIRAVGGRRSSDVDLAAPWCREGDIAGWLSRSTWSLALIALWRKKFASGPPLTVWVPDFFCNTSLSAIRHTGARLVFYPLVDRMAPDIAVCRTMASAGRPDLFLLVHYFGQPRAAAAARDFCAQHGAWLIEDAAHVLRPVDGIGVYGDFVIYSPHKHLPIPDGALLVARSSGAARLGEDGLKSFGVPTHWPAQLQALQQELGCSGRRGRLHAVAWLLKRVLQKLGVRPPLRTTIPFAQSLSAGPTVSEPLIAPPQSSLARRLLAVVLPDIAVVARKRQRHQMMWDAVLLDDEAPCREVDRDRVSALDRPAHREWTPYLAAYRTDPAYAEATYSRWQRDGVPVTTWPDLPPEVIAQWDRHPYAWALRHGRLYLPVHQSLSASTILSRFYAPTECDERVPGVRLAWNGATRRQWQNWIEQVSRPNLLQTWSYGEAKSEQSGWRVKRGLVWRDQEPFAVVQVLQRRVAGVLTVTRINRGPVFLGTATRREQQVVWENLSRLGSWWRGRVLSVSPELRLSGSALVFMHDLRFRQFSPLAWESVWIDLEPELDMLRRQLDRKWRNMLTTSEKAGLTLEIGSDDRMFEWMIAQYQTLMKDRRFEGPPVSLLQRLRACGGNDAPLLMLRALRDGAPMAGICVARHGAAATYLLGWNGDEGRRLKANQFLLWQAIAHLKASGVRWFDLGGISEEHTPGITNFKLGLNGNRYELVGDYWKW